LAFEALVLRRPEHPTSATSLAAADRAALLRVDHRLEQTGDPRSRKTARFGAEIPSKRRPSATRVTEGTSGLVDYGASNPLWNIPSDAGS
jgi:hypothetical protein